MSIEQDTCVIGITGSIAAYKAADLVSKLVQNHIRTQVIITENGARFIGVQTLLTLSHQPVIRSLWDVPEWQPEHIALAERARLLVIVPATANILAKMAHGIADDALSTYYLSHTGPVMVVPAMNPRMWKHPATQANCRILRERGVQFIGPVSGHVACGEEGEGRMAPPEDILNAVLAAMNG